MATGAQADLVVVGGGTVGGWASVFAVEAGLRTVVVLERGLVGDGASSRAAGIVRAQGGTPQAVAMGRWSIEFYRGQAARYGTDSGFRELGYLLLASSREDEQVGRARVAMQQALGLEVRWVEAPEAVRLAGTLASTGHRGGSYLPTDGAISPPRNVRAYSLVMQAAGVQLRERTAFTGLIVRRSRVVGVRTSAGPIATGRVLLTGGPGLHAVGRLAGINIPAGAARHTVAVTEANAAFEQDRAPMVFDVRAGLYWRLEEGGLLFGWSDPDEAPGEARDIDRPALDRTRDRLAELVPATRGLGLRKVWAATIDYTADHQPILGPGIAPDGTVIAGLTVASAGGHGMMWGPAVARIAVDLATTGLTAVADVGDLGLDRFDAHGRSRLPPDRSRCRSPSRTSRPRRPVGHDEGIDRHRPGRRRDDRIQFHGRPVGVRHERLTDGRDDRGGRRAVHRGAAAQAVEHARGSQVVEHLERDLRGQGQEAHGHVVKDLGEHPAEADQHDRSELRIPPRRDQEFQAGPRRRLDQHTPHVLAGGAPGGQHVPDGPLQAGVVRDTDRHRADVALVGDVGGIELDHHGPAHARSGRPGSRHVGVRGEGHGGRHRHAGGAKERQRFALRDERAAPVAGASDGRARSCPYGVRSAAIVGHEARDGPPTRRAARRVSHQASPAIAVEASTVPRSSGTPSAASRTSWISGVASPEVSEMKTGSSSARAAVAWTSSFASSVASSTCPGCDRNGKSCTRASTSNAPEAANASEARPVGRAGLVRAPRIHGVADVAQRGQGHGDPVTGRLRQGRQVERRFRRQVRHQGGLTGRDGHHAGAAASDPAAHAVRARDQGGRLEDLVQVAEADHARRAEGRLAHPILAGQRAGVRPGRHPGPAGCGRP